MGCIGLIATGGTIASMPQANGGVHAALAAEDLVGRLAKDQLPEIKPWTFATVGSFSLTFNMLFDLAHLILQLLEKPDIDGVVVTHGTDTLEETAYYLRLVIPPVKPVVLTGSQRDAGHPQSDGPQNLADAIVAATEPGLAAFGPVVAFAGELHGSREVRKIDTAALQAFASPGWGPIGRIDRQRIVLRDTRPRRYPLLRPAIPVSIPLLRLVLGITGDEVKRTLEGHPAAVLQAFGRGNAPESVTPVVRALVEQGTAIVVTSRCLSGAVAPIYTGGGGKDLEHAGAWFAGDLSGEKARILMGLGLAQGLEKDALENLVKAWAVA